MTQVKKTIPIILMFNDSYALPAGVAICSLLSNANKNYNYNIHILHEDITKRNIFILTDIVSRFSNSRIFFKDMGNVFTKEWDMIKTKQYYSKECLYKLLLPQLFKNYDRVVVTDVDVVFRGDISPSIDLIDDRYYIMGYRPPYKLLQIYDNYTNTNKTIRRKLKEGIGAGFMVYNLSLMRQDNVQEKLLESLSRHISLLIQPEQDIINIVLYKRIGYLPLEYCFCTYMYNLFRKEDELNTEVSGHTIDYLLKKYKNNLQNDKNYSKEELLRAFDSPVQIHFANGIKPWLKTFTKRKSDWLYYLLKTPYRTRYFLGIFYNLLK